jgi:hypothetical protein
MEMEQIGDLRRSLFTRKDSEWNSIVREITANHEIEGMWVPKSVVLVELAEHLQQIAEKLNGD